MGQTILLADDSITIQKVIELTFSDEDFKLHTVGNGQKAIEEIRSVQPDIVLCDIIMPEKSGYEVCEFIKTNDDLKHIPVLLLTGAFEPFDQERARKAGCDGFLAKPFEPQTLISKVKELLASSVSRDEKAPKTASPTPQPPAPPAAAAPTPIPTMGAGPTLEIDPMPGGRRPQAPPARPAIEPKAPPSNDFAVEAGQRELAVAPGDRKALLGTDSPAEKPAVDDIWSQVQQIQEPPPSPGEGVLDDGSTAFMSPPPAAPPETPPSPPARDAKGFELPSTPQASAAEDGSTVFLSPSPEPAGLPPTPPPTERGASPESLSAPEDDGATVFLSEPPPTPPESSPSTPRLADVSFDAFASAPESSGQAENGAWVIEEEPPQTAEPELGSLGGFGGFSDFASQEEDSSLEPGTDTPAPTPPQDMAPSAPVPPGPARPPAPAMSGFDGAVSDTLQVPPKPQPRDDSSVEAPAALKPTSPSEPVRSEEPQAAQEPPAKTAGLATDDLVEQVAQKVIAKLSEKAIQSIAWEVVPDLAEALIQKEIDALKAKIPE